MVIANSVFMSCTDLDENLENNTEKLETLSTDGEDTYDPEEEEDPANGG